MRRYHHGDLRRALLQQAAAVAAESGAELVQLRDLARRLGVSHAAPAHHFRSRQELLTALAVEGFEELGRALRVSEGDVYDLGVEYVQWALSHPGAYIVMWQPRLLDESDQELVAARRSAWNELSAALEHTGEAKDLNSQAAFALVHGVSSLLLAGAPPIAATSRGELHQLLRRFQPQSCSQQASQESTRTE